MTPGNPTILIIEDGDEYLNNLSRFVEGPQYIQAKNGADAARRLRQGNVDLIYLDMRFDRIALSDLMGDHSKAAFERGGDEQAAWKHLQINQGLFILHELKKAGFANIPVILAYDFSREPQRFVNLKKQYPKLRWVSDAVTADEIRKMIEDLC